MIERFAFYLLFSLYTLYLTDEHHLSERRRLGSWPLSRGDVLHAAIWRRHRGSVWRCAPSSSVLHCSHSDTFCWRSVCRSFRAVLLATGVGLFKNLTALVGSLFPPTERDAATADSIGP